MQEKKKTSAKRRTIFGALYIVVISGVVVFFALRENILEDIMQALANLLPGWLVMAALALALFFVFDALSQWFAVRSILKGVRIGFWQTLKICAIGQFYNAVTPTSSGGQPFQVYYMKKQGVPVGTSSSVMLIKLVLYEVSMLLMAVGAMILYDRTIEARYSAFVALAAVGIVLAVLTIIIALTAMMNIKLTMRLTDGLLKLFVRIKLVRHPDKTRARAYQILQDFHQCREFLAKKPGHTFTMFLFVFAHMFSYFAIVYFVYRAFGLQAHSPLTVILLQAFFHISVAYFPMPGASGASEGGFLLFYRHFFTPKIVFTAMLIWRAVTYYGKIAIGAAVIIGDTAAKTMKGRGKSAEAPQIKPGEEI
ncbi:MAG: lysylphosphatidylglycerol synthase transmembrane domain-containing protein [Christensenellales bacterium]|jgi:uncharacterized protein (TIRG00374 family)